MPEILTESFCERCGTRYTFESAAPRKARRLSSFKTLSKGLKNYVLSDDTSMDEAMAAARSDEEREATAQQLDAFHATFNFCMNCRQYTCGNCWNQAEGRCLTCAPNLGQEILPAAFPNEIPFRGAQFADDAWPTADLPNAEPGLEEILARHGGNGTDGAAPADVEAEPSNGVVQELEPVEDIDLGARLSFLTADRAPEEVPATTEPVAAEPVASEVVTEPLAQAVVSEPAGIEPAAEEPIATEEPLAAAAAGTALDPLADRASELVDHTSVLLGRFRPGQNIDAELAAYEAAQAGKADAPEPEPLAAAAEAKVVAPAPEPTATEFVAAAPEAPVAEQKTVAAQAEPEPEAMAAAEPVAAATEPIAAAAEPVAAPTEPEPEPVAAEPQPERVAAEPQPEPVAAEPEPVAATPQPVVAEPAGELPRVDRIQQPTWQIFAPDQSVPSALPPAPAVAPVVPPPAPQASSEPQWPTQPDVEESPSMALLANRAKASSDALWAASAQQVLSPANAGPTAPVSGVQPCSNCGLSLSATARFCRRCGTRQG